MPPLLSAIANAGRHGVLIKSAVVMERLGQTDRIAYDKTGTLTEGTPHLTEVLPEPGFSEHELLLLAAAAEQRSEHPLARAIVAAAQDLPQAAAYKSYGEAYGEAYDFRSAPGCGVTAILGVMAATLDANQVRSCPLPDPVLCPILVSVRSWTPPEGPPSSVPCRHRTNGAIGV
ncbi:hypothetical protein GCM10017557_28680 [Streptomyces aurantiacus]|uniref:HAD family hydrolase n=1 Tax=Streptomyces aurantiacus TaxID=47760 RepID=A0A7G1NYI4_9ACTN|nr:hypothetical protein GCM10017557_28680 [Streptomyces aurantiacus]